MELEIRHSEVFTWNSQALDDPKIRNIINIGSSRSSKSHSLCQLIIVWCLLNDKKVVSIVRKSFPTLRGSIMKDFFEILTEMGIYNQKMHNKTEHTYNFPNGSQVEFFACDDQQKLRGRKRNLLFINEANELNRDEYIQLNIRTVDKLLFDFNPSDTFHWLYDLMEQDNSKVIHSTYKNNPFLPQQQIDEIENLKNIDEDYYRIFALGERGTMKTSIFGNVDTGDIPRNWDEVYYGLDIGFNHPTAMVALYVKDDVCYLKELIYKSGLTVNDTMDLIQSLNIDRDKEILVDSARPDVIDDLRRLGYNSQGANKEVKNGITAMKSQKIILDRNSINLIKEFKTYKWKTKGDIVLEEPVKIMDDLCDASRYAVYHYYNLKKDGGNFSMMFSNF